MLSLQEAQALMEKIKRGEDVFVDDYFGGESITLGFDREKMLFYVRRFDTIVGSYNITEYYPENEFIGYVQKYGDY
jgi:hypothetical protein